MSYVVEKFDGCVITKHWSPLPDGKQYRGFVGKVSILEGKGALGFEIKDDSNWIARIEDDDGTSSVNIPGCQVHAVLQGVEFTAGVTSDFFSLNG